MNKKLKTPTKRVVCLYRWEKNKMNRKNKMRKKRGQGLIEYLILVALMAVATIGVIRVLNQTVKSRFANAVHALQGTKKKVKTHAVKESDYQKSDLSDFMTGAASDPKSKKKKK